MNLIGQGELLAIASSITFGFTQILVRQGIQNASPVAAALIMNSMVSILYQNKPSLNLSDDAEMLYYYNSSCLHPDLWKPNSFMRGYSLV